MTDEYVKVFDGEYGSYLKYPYGDNDKLLAGLSYIFGLVVSLVALFAIKPLSPYLRFHAIQALGIHIVYMAIAMVMGVTMMFIVGICLLPFVMGIGIYALIIGVMVLTGGDHRVPWLGNYVEENYV
jgi:uncharacterized membrane protein